MSFYHRITVVENHWKNPLLFHHINDLYTKRSNILKQICNWKAAGLFKYVWTFSRHQALKGFIHVLVFVGVHNNFSIFFKAAVHKSSNNTMVSATRTAFRRGEIWTCNRCVELWVWFHLRMSFFHFCFNRYVLNSFPSNRCQDAKLC